MLLQFGILALVICIAMLLSILTRKLTIPAALTGGLLGVCVFIGAGFIGIAMVALFFVLGTLATSWKMEQKQRLGVAENNKGRRTASQVLANAGVAGAAGLLAGLYPEQTVLFRLLMAASLSSAIADTLSSELGTLYGSMFYNVLTFKKDKRGENGVVSLEGTFFGLAGSSLIALIYALGFGWGIDILWIIIAGTIGNLFDSLLGAGLERKNLLGNDAVNLLNTLVAAFSMLLLV